MARTTFFQELRARAGSARLQFLVIGGLALNFHGVSRETADLDLLVCRDDREAWRHLLEGLGHRVVRGTSAFIQFSPPREGAWPVDLMQVGAETFAQMLASGREAVMYGAGVKIASLNHLLALKLHALAHSHVERFMKDYLDVENLVRANRLDLHSKEVRDLFLKYGNVELYEKIKTTFGASGENSGPRRKP